MFKIKFCELSQPQKYFNNKSFQITVISVIYSPKLFYINCFNTYDYVVLIKFQKITLVCAIFGQGMPALVSTEEYYKDVDCGLVSVMK